ncbi:unnamed protein product [Effrenium voratum]|nr:unnamed protein product [Effrenium voratum]
MASAQEGIMQLRKPQLPDRFPLVASACAGERADTLERALARGSSEPGACFAAENPETLRSLGNLDGDLEGETTSCDELTRSRSELESDTEAESEECEDELDWWNPGGMSGLEEGYAPDCPCD